MTSHEENPPREAPAPPRLRPISVRIPVAVQMTGISRSRLYELIRSGELEIVKIGSSTLVPVASLEQLIEVRRRHTRDDLMR